MAPTINVVNDRKSKCRKSQRRIQHTSGAVVSVISYGRTTSRARRCWNHRPSRLPIMGKISDREIRRESVDEDFDGDAGAPLNPMVVRRQSTSSMSESDTSSGCSSGGHSLNFSRTQFCRCDSLNMSDYDDDGFKDDDKSDHSYTSRMEMRPMGDRIYNGNGSKGLLDIAIRTIKLIRRNQLLQAKLAQLQNETHAFIASVMANPENRDASQSIYDKESPRASPSVDDT